MIVIPLVIIVILVISLLLYCLVFKKRKKEFNDITSDNEKIFRYKNEIEIQFQSPTDGNFSININPNKKIKDVINMYYSKKGFGVEKIFLFNGDNLSLKENQDKQINYFIQKSSLTGKFVIVVCDKN